MLTAVVIGYLVGQRAGIQALDVAATHRLDVFHASFFSPVERYEYLPDLLATHPSIVSTLAHGGDARAPAALNAFLQEVNSTVDAAAVYVMNPQGLTVASSNWQSADSFVGKNFSFRPYFQEALQGKPGSFYGVGAVTGVPGFFLASAVREGGATIGVIAVKVDLDTLDQHWLTKDDQIAVTDGSGVIFLSSNPQWKYRTTKPLSADVLQRLRDTRQYATLLKSPLNYKPDALWRDDRVVRIEDPETGTSDRYLALDRSLPQAGWTITSYSSMEQAERTATIYAFLAATGMAFLLLLGLYLQLMRRRLMEKEAARRAADHARAQLEAKHRELEILSRNLQTMAISDPLTGCHNRRYFTEIAGKMVSAAQRHKRCISVLMLDIDFFKKINDGHGHPAGDAVLKAVAVACQSQLRQPDFLVRFGGEEFVAILPDTELDEAIVAAERLRSAVALLRVPAAQAELRVTVSIGIAEFDSDETSLDKALSRADIALYYVKHGGRNACLAYRPDMAPLEDETTPQAH